MKIHLIRHTTPDIKKGICYGRADIALNDNFDHEAKQILTTTSKAITKYDLVFSSPLQRCRLLAEKLPHEKLQIADDLMEINFGDWELKYWDEIPINDSLKWTEDFINTAPPNGENLLSMQKRTLLFFEKILSIKCKNVAIVTHAGVIRLFISHILEVPLEKIFNLKLKYGAIIEIKSCNQQLDVEFL